MLNSRDGRLRGCGPRQLILSAGTRSRSPTTRLETQRISREDMRLNGHGLISGGAHTLLLKLESGIFPHLQPMRRTFEKGGIIKWLEFSGRSFLQRSFSTRLGCARTCAVHKKANRLSPGANHLLFWRFCGTSRLVLLGSGCQVQMLP